MKLRWDAWHSVSDGRSTPGARVAAVRWGSGYAAFVADPNGGIYATGGSLFGSGPWASVSEGSTTPGAPVTAVPWTERFPFALFIADANGGIYTAAGDPQNGFGPWAWVSEGRSTPGAPVTAVPWTERFPFALFIADANGGIYTVAGDPQNGFGPWANVSQGSTTPGAPVTAVPWTERFPFALFIADANGGIYTAAGDPQNGFGPWAWVSEGRSTPGAPVAAVLWRNDFALFIADPNGGICTTRGDPQNGFGPWAGVANGQAASGSRISVIKLPWNPNLLGVFVSDANGEIRWTAGSPDARWQPWMLIQSPRGAPGSPVTPVVFPSRVANGPVSDYLSLFTTRTDGLILKTWAQVPAPPDSLTVSSVSPHTINVAWTDGHDDFDGFRIRFAWKRAGLADHTGEVSAGDSARTATLGELLSGYEYTIRAFAFNSVGESISSSPAVATVPIAPDTLNFDLLRQEIIEGPVPYAGIYPAFGFVPAGHLLQIALPQSLTVLGLSFVKAGHSTQQCNNRDAVVVLRAGETTTETQMTDIFGQAKPRYDSTHPIGLAACLLSPPGAQLPNFVRIVLTTISDG